MTTQAVLSGFLAILIGLVAYLANKLGKKSAQLEVIKQEQERDSEAREYAKEITDIVNDMAESTVRDRLSQIASDKKR